MGWGMDIEAGRIRICRAEARGGRIRVLARREVALPPGAIQPSLKEANLKDVSALRTDLQAACRELRCRGWVGVALPDAAFLLRRLATDAVPSAPADARRFLAWQARELLPFPAEEARLDFLPPQSAPDGRLQVVCLLARERVIREYESLLEEAGLAVAVLDARSTSLAQAGATPPTGPAALLSIQAERSTLLLLEGGRPRFWRLLAYGRADWGSARRLKAFRELADSLAYCEEREGIGRPDRLTLEGGGEHGDELLGPLEGWLGLPVSPMRLPLDAADLDGWGAAIGAAIRPW